MKTVCQFWVLVSFFVLFMSTKGFAQIDVFTNNCLQLSQTEFTTSTGNIEAGCIETPNDGNLHIFSPTSDREIKAGTYIEFNTGTIIEGQNAETKAYIEPTSFEVVAYVDDLTAVPRLEKFELGIRPPEFILSQIQNFLEESGSPQINPYLSNNIRITTFFELLDQDPLYVHFMGPAGNTQRDAFYYKEVERDISGFEDLYNHPSFFDSDLLNLSDFEGLGLSWNVESSEYPFRVRFAPTHVGRWSGKIVINIGEGAQVFETPTFFFTVVPSTKSDFVRVGQTKRYLTRDGKTYFPNGINFPVVSRYGYPMLLQPNGNSIIGDPMYSASLPPIGFFEQGLRYIDTLKMNGVNHMRILMSPWCSEIEWETLGNYDGRQNIAKEMDLILEKAEEHDITLNWNLAIHNRFCEYLFQSIYWDWVDGYDGPWDIGDPYNRELNLDEVINFFTDTDAIFYWKERLRYVVARWGYSPQIAMFELMSEIDQVGKRFSPALGMVTHQEIYSTNFQVLIDWQKEMARYLKEDLHIPQLLTASYTTFFVTNYSQTNDDVYKSPYLDLMGINNYNYSEGDVHEFHRNKIRSFVSNQGGNQVQFLKEFNKPIFFSESGAHQTWECDNWIESRRNIWQNAFWGVAGALDWEIEQLQKHPNPSTSVWSIYQRVSEFMEGVNLDQGNWHAGMVERKNNGQLQYKPAFLDDCIRDDELADVVYLRSGDRQRAFGVITNRRANYYTMGTGNCSNKNVEPLPPGTDDESLLRTYASVAPGNKNKERLWLRNMGKITHKFQIKYYSPFDLNNPIAEDTRWGKKIRLEHPVMDTLYIVLFEVVRNGESFKNLPTTTETTISDTELSNLVEGKNENVDVYPNPTDGDFVVFVENADKVKFIQIVDALGQQVEMRKSVLRENHFTNLNLKAGTYFVRVVFDDGRVVRKVVIH